MITIINRYDTVIIVIDRAKNKMLALKSKIIDGQGWNSARKNLEETFNEMDIIYNIEDLEHGIINSLK